MADKDLAFLHECSNDELDVLVEIIKSRGTEMLTVTEKYEKYAPDHQKYVAEIEQELIDFGTTGGGLRNIFFGNKPYNEILRDVCKELEVTAASKASTSTLEDALLETVLFQMWDELANDNKRTLAESLGREAQMIFERNGLSYDSLRESFRARRRASYNLSALLADSIAQKYSKRNLEFAKNLGQTLAIGLFSGPLAMIFAIWKVAGPAFQVTVPAAIYIAALRRMKEYDDFARMCDEMQFGEVGNDDWEDDDEYDDDEDDDEYDEDDDEYDDDDDDEKKAARRRKILEDMKAILYDIEV